MHAVCVLVNDRPLRDALDASIQMELHAVFLIRLHQKRADLRVGRARDFGHHLDHDDLRADGSKVARHLETNDAAADTAERLRRVMQRQNFAVRQHKAGF